jgi:hypothetical protein
MKDLTKQIKTGGQTSIKIGGCRQYRPEPSVLTYEGYNNDLVDYIAAAQTRTVQYAELPAVAADEFESLFSWFVS